MKITGNVVVYFNAAVIKENQQSAPYNIFSHVIRKFPNFHWMVANRIRKRELRISTSTNIK